MNFQLFELKKFIESVVKIEKSSWGVYFFKMDGEEILVEKVKSPNGFKTKWKWKHSFSNELFDTKVNAVYDVLKNYFNISK